MCRTPETDGLDTRLHRSYFDLDRVDEDGGAVTYELTDGAWVRLLRANGFKVEALVELHPPSDATSTYEDFGPLGWARCWPAEELWRARTE
jgi:hypothetical protein